MFPYFASLGTNFSATDLFLVWRRDVPTHPQLLSCVTGAVTHSTDTTQGPTLWPLVLFATFRVKTLHYTQSHKLILFPVAIFIHAPSLKAEGCLSDSNYLTDKDSQPWTKSQYLIWLVKCSSKLSIGKTNAQAPLRWRVNVNNNKKI